MQSRTHTCGELRMEHVGQKVQLAGWMENVREVGGSLAFVVVRDFYGKTQLVVENEDLLRQLKGINKESTIGVIGTVRERASKNPNMRKSPFSAAAAIMNCRLKSTAAVKRTRRSA